MNDIFDIRNKIFDKIIKASYDLGKYTGQKNLKKMKQQEQYIKGLSDARKIVYDAIIEKLYEQN